MKFNFEDLLTEMTPFADSGRFFCKGISGWNKNGKHYDRYTIRFYYPYISDGQSPRLYHLKQKMSVIGAIRVDLPFITFVTWRKVSDGWRANYDIPLIRMNICEDPPSDITKALYKVLNGYKNDVGSGRAPPGNILSQPRPLDVGKSGRR